MSKKRKSTQSKPDFGPMLVRSTPNHIVHIQRTPSPLKLRIRIIPKISAKTRQPSSIENTLSYTSETASSCSSRASSVSGLITPKSAADVLPSHISSVGVGADNDGHHSDAALTDDADYSCAPNPSHNDHSKRAYDDEEAASDRLLPSSCSSLELAHIPFDPSELPRPEVQIAYIALLESRGYKNLPPAIIVR